MKPRANQSTEPANAQRWPFWPFALAAVVLVGVYFVVMLALGRTPDHVLALDVLCMAVILTLCLLPPVTQAMRVRRLRRQAAAARQDAENEAAYVRGYPDLSK